MPRFEELAGREHIMEEAMGHERFNEIGDVFERSIRMSHAAEAAMHDGPGSQSFKNWQAERATFVDSVNQLLEKKGVHGKFSAEELFAPDAIHEVSEATPGSKWHTVRETVADMGNAGGSVVRKLVDAQKEAIEKVQEKGEISRETAPKTFEDILRKIKDKSHFATFLKIAAVVALAGWTLDQLAKAQTGCFQHDLRQGSASQKVCDAAANADLCRCDHASAADKSLLEACAPDQLPPCWDKAEDEVDPAAKHYNYVYVHKTVGDVIGDLGRFVRDAADMIPKGILALPEWLSKIFSNAKYVIAVVVCVLVVVVVVWIRNLFR
jgi:post-segregation antitoxin (ccd killing protein)